MGNAKRQGLGSARVKRVRVSFCLIFSELGSAVIWQVVQRSGKCGGAQRIR